MSMAEISLIGVTVAFTALVVWVFWPSRRERLEAHAHTPLDDESASTERTEPKA
jgi:FtsZ-interacting cell division protein ZipA